MNPKLEPLLTALETGASELARRTTLLRKRLDAHERFLQTGQEPASPAATMIANVLKNPLFAAASRARREWDRSKP